MMHDLALTMVGLERYEEAKRIQHNVVERWKRKLGVDHPATLAAMSTHSMMLVNLDRLEEAAKLYAHTLEAEKGVFGEEHPNILSTMNNLAYTWYLQGNVECAMNHMERCAAWAQKFLDPEHPDRLSLEATLKEWKGELSE
ncbi:hypothetical protein BX600DRAFT_439272 [Xylariales sp. PMI_506]|nr:hypothetical protein BX600DRAFT_439272 [Xylariales sp. PMI_506]